MMCIGRFGVCEGRFGVLCVGGGLVWCVCVEGGFSVIVCVCV